MFEATLDAVNDDRLYGEFLLQPFRLVSSPLKHVFSSLAPNSSRVTEVFKRILTCGISSAATLVSLPFAAVGVAAKWVDLSCRMHQFVHKGPAITWSLNFPLEYVSRLGDRTIAYLHAKYASEKYGIPVYFHPFAGSELFAFSKEEKLQANPTKPLYFERVVYLKSPAEIATLAKVDKEASVLYVLCGGPAPKMEVNWKDYKQRLQQLLEVTQPHTPLEIPQDSYSVGLHIRTGGDFDRPDTVTTHPKKLPPLCYYTGELENLLQSQLVPKDKPFFVHIFTDDLDPSKICKQIQEDLAKRSCFPKCNGQEIILSYTQRPRLVDDVANMKKFHCLIRPDSNLSGTLALAADRLEVEISPVHSTLNDDYTEVTIDQAKRVSVSGGVEMASVRYTRPAVKQWDTTLALWFVKKLSS